MTASPRRPLPRVGPTRRARPSWRGSRWGAWAPPRRSRRWRSISPPTNPPSQPAPSTSSTAAGRCNRSGDIAMKLLRYGPAGQEKPGLLDGNGVLRDLSGVVPDIGGEVLSPDGLARLKALDPAKLPAVSGNPRLGPCVAGVGKFICIGLNYSDHAAETGATVPPEPIIFMKATSAITGPNDDVIIPKNSVKTDWEVELGVVIGSVARYVSEQDAMKHIAGYCVVNDVSERAFQTERHGQWTKGKSADSFGPIGPWLVTADEVPDPQDLAMFCDVNGHRFQNG